VAALILVLTALVAPVSADPPGNNGTVKIDGIPFDDHPNNEPHPGCVFQVDFYGYDAGALFASVRFEHWNPTGDGHGDVLLHEEGIAIGEDDNSGGGSEAGLDASRTYDLSAQLAGQEPHPQQGFHIKLTVHADGSQGADVKHKVFWVDCPAGGGGGVQGQFLLQKVDQTGAGRAGAVFTLTGVSGTTFSATATTSATGSAAFSALSAGSYSLAETTPPTGCTGFAGTLAITVAADGAVSFGTLPTGVSVVSGTVRVVNNCAPAPPVTGNVPLLKVDQAGAGKAGAVFTLTGVMGTSFTGTATSGATGSATLSGLSAGSYSLAETTPPTGCTGFAGTLAITVAANGTVSFGTLPSGVTIVSGTVRAVNTCGAATQGGTSPSAGGGVTSRAGTLSSSAGGAGAAGLPNTAMERPSDGLTAELLVLAAIAALGMGWRRVATSARRRR
jgi:hypothetical protein